MKPTTKKKIYEDGNVSLTVNHRNGESSYKLTVQRSDQMRPYIWMTQDEMKRIRDLLTMILDKEA